VAGSAGSLALWQVPVRDVSRGWDHFSGQSSAPDDLVPGYVAGHQPKERHQRFGIAACFGLGQLQNRLGDAPQTAPGHGETGARTTFGKRGSGRNLPGRAGRGCSRSADREQGVDCGGGRGRRPRDRADSDAADCGRFGPWSIPTDGWDTSRCRSVATFIKSRFYAGNRNPLRSCCRACIA
jgi:hypothetical protein